MTPLQQTAPFPGGVGITRLRVYDWEDSNGVCGGSPHMHTASTEAYFVLAGTGHVETIRSTGYETYDLAPNDVLWFSPGTIHRLVNHDNLEILAIMQNGGLPEAGDAVLTFEEDVVGDPNQYARAAALSSDPSASLPDAARARRDAALAGYERLKAAALAGDQQAVERFQQDAVRLVQGRVPTWQALWTETIAPESARTGTWLRDLANGNFGHFREATVSRADPMGAEGIFGMCGMLQKWDTTYLPGATRQR
ncbi:MULTISPECIES: cupin domain-containing protein [unclassified Arthrobacter]|uniref:cupin domain-containing protein n=1 Tax=unclassified Arthrobacter TaxID=235627 RepID=UPI0028832F6C|nr:MULTISPECIES: cupin domain-containing protein [unclassified Arthrobacter]